MDRGVTEEWQLTTLYISRSVNESLSLSLMSTMSTLNTTADLNGTVITCSSETFGQSLANASLLLILARNNSGNLLVTPSVNISEDYQMNLVAVTLEWVANNGVSYVVYVAPERAINYTGTSSAQLLLSYNIKYNVSVVASLCGTSQVVHRALNYKRCPQILLVSTSDSIQVTNPVTVQTRSVNLTVAVFSSTIATVCVTSSIVFLSIGYACGWFSHKHKRSCTARKAASDSSADYEENAAKEGSQLPPTPGPLYEELQQRSTPEHQDLVELKENVAYGPIVK